MLKKLKNLSLQMKIMALFFGTSIVLTLTLGLIFYNNTVENVKSNKENEIQTLANETANKIERFLFEREADIRVVAESQILTMAQIDDATRLKYIENVVANYKTYDEILVVNMDGDLLLNATYTKELQKMRSIEYLKQHKAVLNAILSGETFVSDILSEENKTQRFLFFSEPLHDANGKLTGAVIERMNFDVIEEIIENVKLADIGHAALMPSDGKYGVSYETIDGEEQLTVSVPMIKYETQTQQWMLVLSEPTDEAFAILHDIRIYFGLLFCITLIILYLVSSYLSKRITRPIKMLKHHMDELLGTHKLNMSLAYEGTSDEMKQMTHTFDFLLEELSFMVQRTMEKTGEAESVKSVKATLDAMIEHTITGIITIDGKGVITSINPRVNEILQIDDNQSALVGRSVEQLVNQRFRPLFEMVEKSIENDKQLEEIRCQLMDPEILLVVSTLIQKDIYQTPLGVTIMIQSVADKERFEHSVIRAKKLSELGELSAGVAHEIRNPLASIRGYTQMAVLEVSDNDVAVHDLRIVLNEVDRLDRLIDRFLSFASPNAPYYVERDMNDLIEEVVQLLEQQMRVKKINLIFHLHEASIFEFDSDQMKQVLINLILNAIQASNEASDIEIASTLHEDENYYVLSIKDSGDGIDEALHDRIFTPFFTTRAGGTGLGLAICARIVENHQGTIELMSAKDTGTTFTIKLPTKKGEVL